jgi:hypothetical protein
MSRKQCFENTFIRCNVSLQAQYSLFEAGRLDTVSEYLVLILWRIFFNKVAYPQLVPISNHVLFTNHVIVITQQDHLL